MKRKGTLLESVFQGWWGPGGKSMKPECPSLVLCCLICRQGHLRRLCLSCSLCLKCPSPFLPMARIRPRVFKPQPRAKPVAGAWVPCALVPAACGTRMPAGPAGAVVFPRIPTPAQSGPQVCQMPRKTGGELMAGRGKAGASLELPKLGPAVPLQAYPSSLTLCESRLPSEHSRAPHHCHCFS